MEPHVSSTSEAKLKLPRANDKVYFPQTNERFKSCPQRSFPCQPFCLWLIKCLSILCRTGAHNWVRWQENRGLYEAQGSCLSWRKTSEWGVWRALLGYHRRPHCSHVHVGVGKWGNVSWWPRSEKSCQMSKREGGTSTVAVTPSAQEALLAAGSRIASGAVQSKAANSCSIPIPAENFLWQTSGVRGCVVHGRPLLADKKGGVHLQFHAGRAWVPDTAKKRISLWLIPACTWKFLCYALGVLRGIKGWWED